MPKRIQLRDQFQTKLNDYLRKRPSFLGTTGDGNGNFAVAGRAGYIHVRENVSGIPHQVLNMGVPLDKEYVVEVGFDERNPSLEVIIGILNNWTQEQTSRLNPHHETHEWPGGRDITQIAGGQILPGLVITKSGMTVSIFPFWKARVDGTRTLVAYQEVDLTDYRPTDFGAWWALLSFDDDGVLHVKTGAQAGSWVELTGTLMPVADERGYSSPAAVQLGYGQTTIVQNERTNQIADLRWDGGGFVDADEPLIARPWILTPAVITGQQDDYDPTGFTSDILLLRIASTGAQSITGLANGGNKRQVIFQNIGTSTITFPDEDSGSAAANRFAYPVSLPAGEIVVFMYRTDASRWEDYGNGAPSILESNTWTKDRVVMIDAVGNVHTLDWVSVRPGSQQLVVGKDIDGNTIPLPGGYSIHAIDSLGHTGGEMFTWAVGVGTGHSPQMDDKDFVGRFWGMRMRGTIDAPVGILDGDAIVELVGVGWGDNGNFNAAGETYQAEVTNKVKLVFRAVGDWTDTSRATAIEFYTTPTASLVRALAAAFDPDGSLNMHSHKVTNVADPVDAQDVVTKAWGEANLSVVLPDWQTPTLAGTWSNYGGAYAPAQYFKDGRGWVHLRGLVAGGGVPSTIFTLPAHYRPDYQVEVLVDAVGALGVCTINTDGTVVATAGSDTYFSLDEIVFYTDDGLITPPAWNAVSFENGWADFGTPYANAEYLKDGLGIVHLRGVIAGGSTGAAAFTLPLGFRPLYTFEVLVDSNGALGICVVNADGTVIAAVGDNTAYSLDGITIYT